MAKPHITERGNTLLGHWEVLESHVTKGIETDSTTGQERRREPGSVPQWPLPLPLPLLHDNISYQISPQVLSMELIIQTQEGTQLITIITLHTNICT